MIHSFGDAATDDLFHGRKTSRVRRFPQDVLKGARRKLDMVNAALRLEDLRVPPANRLEALKGAQTGLYGIRINDQFRVVFRWLDGNALEVRVVDYH